MASGERSAGAPRRQGMAMGNGVVVAALLIAITACAIWAYPPVAGMTAFAFNLPSPQSLMTGHYARMTVDGFRAIRTSEAGFTPPFEKTVTDARVAQALYDAAFALPGFPADGFSGCPPTWDAAYHLAFTYHGAPVLTIIAYDCYEVSLGDLGNREWNLSFERRLAGALGLDEFTMWNIGQTP